MIFSSSPNKKISLFSEIFKLFESKITYFGHITMPEPQLFICI